MLILPGFALAWAMKLGHRLGRDRWMHLESALSFRRRLPPRFRDPHPRDLHRLVASAAPPAEKK